MEKWHGRYLSDINSPEEQTLKFKRGEMSEKKRI